MTDVHLDTSWCPVCECEIPPKRVQVPVNPPPPTTATAVKTSMTTRGKNGTIKARSGLVQGTGRARPQLNRASSTKGRVAQVVEEPVRMRTVIDPNPTPLYCSEKCRLKDLEDSWPVPQPPAHAVLGAHAPPRRASRTQLGAHPSQINPACASPPPPSPTLPPVPPNSLRMPMNFKSRKTGISPSELNAFILEADEHSDSSSATGTSFSASDRSPVDDFDINDNSNLYTDPQPPPLLPLPLHPHRPSAPVAEPGSRNKKEEPKFDRGIMMTSKRLQEILASGVVDDERTREEKREREEKQRRESERLRRWDFTGEMSRSSSNDREKKKEEQKVDPLRWTEVIYQYNATSSTNLSPSSPAIPSTHRRASDTGRSKVVRADPPGRSQSALELYAKYPLFAKSSAGNGNRKSSASLATSYAPAYGITTSSSSVRSAGTSGGSTARTAGASALTLPGVDPELYAGKRLRGPEPQIEQGLEGKLCLPDILLRPPPQLSSSLPAGAEQRARRSSSGMRRSGSEANVSSKKSGRSTSALGAVREGEEMEGGVWHHQEEGSEDSRSSVTHSSTSDRDRRRKDRKGKSRASSSGQRSPVTEPAAPTWTYDGNGGLLVDAVPPLPETQLRYEEVFIPDPLPGEQPPATTFENEHIGRYIRLDSLHIHDKELSRRPLRELNRRPGVHDGRQGTWVEKEWEVRAIPERKRLFIFNGSKSKPKPY